MFYLGTLSQHVALYPSFKGLRGRGHFKTKSICTLTISKNRGEYSNFKVKYTDFFYTK